MSAPGTRINGQFFRRPGVRSELNGDQLSGSGALPTGIVALVGVFERGVPKTPTEVFSASQLVEALPVTGPKVAPLLFQAGRDDDINGSPFSVHIVRVNPATQAATELKDGTVPTPVAVLDVDAADYGAYGNQITAEVKAATTKGLKYEFCLGKQKEVYDNVFKDVFSLTNADTTELDDLRVIVDPSNGFKVTYATVAFPMVRSQDTLDADPDNIAGPFPTLHGLITATVNNPHGSGTISVAISGTNIATGLADSETIPLAHPATSGTTTKQFKDITAVTVTNRGAATTLDLTSPNTKIATTKVAFDGTVTVTIDQDSGQAGTKAVVRGIENGVETTEDIALASPTVTASGAKKFTDVLDVVLEVKGSATTVKLSGNSFDLALADFPKVADVLDRIDVYKSRGYTATRLTGRLPNVADLDEILTPGTDAQGASTATVTANLYEAIQRINENSSLVALSRPDSGPARVPVVQGPFMLGGGGEGTTQNTDWTNALTAIQTVKPINLVAPLTNDASIHELVRQHLDYMSGDGRDERAAWLGAAKGETQAQLATRIIGLDNRNAGLLGQEIQVYDERGQKVWRDPMYTGVLMCGLAASRKVGVPLTEIQVNVLDIRQHNTWDPDEDAEGLIRDGVCALYKSSDGIRVLRQVTTYVEEDHEAYSLFSVNESANESVKNVRNVLKPFVGKPSLPGLDSTIEKKVIAELDRQVRDGEIFGFDRDSVRVVAITNGYQVEYDFAPVGETAFINVKPSLVRAA